MEHLYILMLIIYLVLINLLTFAVYGIDKAKAIKQKWRIPESTLILGAVIGGSIGALGGMKFFHHKTHKPKFYIGVPLILCAQIAICVYIILKFYHVI